MLSKPFKLDAVSESLSTCLEKRVEACKLRHEGKKSKIRMPKYIFGECVYKAFKFCKKVGPQQDLISLKAIEAESLCIYVWIQHLCLRFAYGHFLLFFIFIFDARVSLF